MFVAMRAYSEKKKLNVFEYVPLTFSLNMKSNDFSKAINEFCRLFKSIEIYNDLAKSDKLIHNKETGETFISEELLGSLREVELRNNSEIREENPQQETGEEV